MALCFSNLQSFAQGTGVAPQITVQPVSQSASTGSDAAFGVTVIGTAPLSYQWRANGTNVPGAASSTLFLTNVSIFNGGSYVVVITNGFGAVTSDVARLNIDIDLTFRIVSLRTNGFVAFEVNNIVGDDRGGMAVSHDNVFLNGDNATAVWRAQDLANGHTVRRYDALTMDLQTETVYSLANGETLLTFGGNVTALAQVDGVTGALTGNRINLSRTISLVNGDYGIFAGYGRIVLYDFSRIYSIAVPSGVVTEIANSTSFSHNYSENWASMWGIAEYFGGYLYLVYAQNFTTIARMRVPGGPITTVASFPGGIGDMASFCLSPSLSRWFFHYEGGGVFGSRDETLGSAKALFTTDPAFPIVTNDLRSQTIRAGTPVTFTIGADGPDLTFQWRLNGNDIDGATNTTFVITNVLPADAGTYTVVISNPSGTLISAAAVLTVISTPFITSGPQNVTTNANVNVFLVTGYDGAAPLSFQWRWNGTNIPGATSSVLSLSNVQTTNQGLYSLVISNSYGLVVSTNATLTVFAFPNIVNQPRNQLAFTNGSATFSVFAYGAVPNSYQWFLDGNPVSGATNVTLNLTNLQPTQAGKYSVVVSNQYGPVASSNAVLTLINMLPENASFRIISLTGSNSAIIDHQALTGSDRGGMAASLSRVFYSGNNATAGFDLLDLANGARINRVWDSMAGDLRSTALYVFGIGSVPLSYFNGNGIVTHLLELDPITGVTNGNRITLSSSIPFARSYTANVGFFSGYGRVLAYNLTNVYSIEIPSGTVSNLGPVSIPQHMFANNWAYWGMAEYFGGSHYLVYVRDTRTIVRTRVGDSQTTTVSSFTSLSSMASFTGSLYYNRWYFHYSGTAQFGTTNQALGYADAIFEVNQVDHYEWSPVPSPQIATAPFSVTLLARDRDNKTVTNFFGSASLSGVPVGGGAPLTVSPDSVTFVNGAWTGQLVLTQATAGVYLRALDSNGNSGSSTAFAVYPINDLFVTIAVNPDPATVGQMLTYIVTVTNTGPSGSSGVILSNFLPAGVQFQSATASIGECANNGGIVRCDLHNLAGGTAANVTIQIMTFAAESITNVATVSRAEPDPSSADDTVIAVTTVNVAALSIDDASIVEGNSGTNFMTVNVWLNAPSTNTVSVSYSTLNGTASASTDFVSKNSTLTFNPGVTNQTISIGVRGDTLYETNEVFSVNLVNPDNAIVNRTTANCTIINDDPAPIVSIGNASLVEGNSGTNNMNFEVRISARTGLQILVAYSSSNVTALAGSDYLPVSGTLSFAANSTTQTQLVSVPILGDTTGESNETFYVNLTSISNALAGNIRGTGTIINDDGIGVLDHFVWNTIPSPQQVNSPFAVTITAKDFFNTTISNFTGTVALSAAVGQSQPTNMILGNLPGPNSGVGDYTIGFAFTPARDITATHLRSYWGTKVSIWTDLGTLVVSRTITNSPGSWSETPLESPVVLSGGLTYRIAAYSGPGTYYLTSDLNPTFPDGTIDQDVFSGGDDFPSLTLSGARFLVDLRYSVGAFIPVSVTPTNSGPFIKGVWSGSITLFSSGTNMTLRADDGAQHRGTSAPFDVEADRADLVLAMAALTQPARLISNFVFSVQVSNAGPATIAAAQFNAIIPAQLQFISATGADGGCSYSNGFLVCSMSRVAPASNVTVTVTTRPLQAGTITNYVVASSAPLDPNFANNVADLIVSICRDCDGDGIGDDWEVTNGLNPLDSSDGSLDPDGDGHSNLQEFLAGTDPNSSNSVMRITAFTLSGDDVRIRFRGVAGKRYALEHNNSMTGSNWTSVVTFRLGSSLTVDLIDSGGRRRTNQYYRVRLVP